MALKKLLAVWGLCLLCIHPVFAASDGHLPRQREYEHRMRNAVDVARIRVPQSPQGFFFRGDSRPPVAAGGKGIFATGFVPRGNNQKLWDHLLFMPGSAYVSVSRSDMAAQGYMFGHGNARTAQGYMYVIAPRGMPRGYWIPEIYPRVLIGGNLEFAVLGKIDGKNIAGAFRYAAYDYSEPAEWIPNPRYQYRKTSPYVPVRNRQFKNVCASVTWVAHWLCPAVPAIQSDGV